MFDSACERFTGTTVERDSGAINVLLNRALIQIAQLVERQRRRRPVDPEAAAAVSVAT